MHYPRDKGLKVHSEGVGLKNALPRRWGLKGALKRKKKRAWRQTIWEIRAQRHTRKETVLQNTLPDRWGLKDTLERDLLVRH